MNPEDSSTEIVAEACKNCGTTLAGRYCAACGQDSHIRLTMRHFLEEIVEGLTHFDSTFWRTVVPLLFRPGELTEHYIRGKRKSTMPPFRSYLVVSLLYFLLSSFSGATQTGFAPTETRQGGMDCATMAQDMPWLKYLVANVEVACQHASRDEGRALGESIAHMLPKVMFLVLPLVALVQFLVYRRQRSLYVESLIFVLHFQSFFFLVGSLSALLTGLVAVGYPSAAHELAGGLESGLYAWSVGYLFVANRRVYGASKLKVIASLAAMGVAYLVFWALGVVSVSLYAFAHA